MKWIMGRVIDLLIKNGWLYDGSGNEPFCADIAITGDRIGSVLPAGSSVSSIAERTIDAKGLSVAPGFIDTHAHSEFTLLADNRAEGKVFQGITTEINGNCGLSAAPLYGEAFRHRETDLQELGIVSRWSDFNEYFSLLEQKGLPYNFATLAGHGNIRASVIGYDDRPPEKAEAGRMCIYLNEALSSGALGISTGLIYPPGTYADTKELSGLARYAKGKIYASHMRSEGDRLIEAIKEAVDIGAESGIAVHISHIKTSGKKNWGKIDDAIALIEDARAKGIKITCDRYPYTSASTDLDAVLPSWTYAGGAEEEIKRLKDKAVCMKIKREVIEQHPDDDYWMNITVSSVNLERNKWMEGRTVAYISNEMGVEPVDLLTDLLIEERLRPGAIFHSMSEDNLRKFLALSYVMIGSDSSARSADGLTRSGKPHPRGFGTFPRFIGRYARDYGLMSISRAIHKVTMLPAETFRLKDRGRVKDGFFADIVIFDEESIIDRATFDEPFLMPEGVEYLIVNGMPVVWQGSFTGHTPGRVLRHGG